MRSSEEGQGNHNVDTYYGTACTLYVQSYLYLYKCALYVLEHL